MSKVNHPSHYQCGEKLADGSSTYEAINVIEAWELGFNLGNVVKYISRSGKKTLSPLEDLKKSQWYLARQIALLEREQQDSIDELNPANKI
jgi:hypothetical protein